MWMNRRLWDKLIDEIAYLRQQLVERDQLLARLDVRDLELNREIRSLRERLIAAEGKARGSAALADSFTIRLNQVQAERDQLFIKVLDPTHEVAIRTPVVGQMARIVGDGDLFTDPAERIPGAPAPGDETRMEDGREVDPEGQLSGQIFRDAREE
jgi:hypothetical protein